MNTTLYFVYVNKIITDGLELLLETENEEEAMNCYSGISYSWTGTIIVKDPMFKFTTLKYYGNPIFKGMMKKAARSHYFQSNEVYLDDEHVFFYLESLHYWLTEDILSDFQIPDHCNTVSDVLFASNIACLNQKYQDLESWHLIREINNQLNQNAYDSLLKKGFPEELIGDVEGQIYFPRQTIMTTIDYIGLLSKEVSILPGAGIAALIAQPEHISEFCDKTPILLIHGCDSNSRQWLTIINLLKEAGFTHIYTIDLDSTRFKTQSSIETYTQKVFEKMEYISEETGTNEIILVGHSMGGIISIEVAYEYPHRVRGVITIASPLVGSIRVTTAKDVGLPNVISHDALNQMEYSSEYMIELGRKAIYLEKEQIVTFYSAYSLVDEMVQPSLSVSRVKTRVCVLQNSGHFSILFSSRFTNWLVETISECQG